MHAARALNTQRKKREEKLQVQQQRVASASSRRSVSRSPVPSDIDLEVGGGGGSLNKRKKPKSGGADCSYVGFIIAIFGLVPLLVGTFIDVPNLWEIGLGLTVFGLLLGVTFCCWDFCIRHATQDLENSNAAKARSRIRVGGKVEDSSLLKPVNTSVNNGKRSRSGSFASVALPLTGGAAGVPTLTNNFVQKSNPSPAICETVTSEVEVTEVKAFRDVNETSLKDNIALSVPFHDVDNDNTEASSDSQVAPVENKGEENPVGENTSGIKNKESIVEDVDAPDVEAEKDESVEQSRTDEGEQKKGVGEGEVSVDPVPVKGEEESKEDVVVSEESKVEEEKQETEAADRDEEAKRKRDELEEVIAEDTSKEEQASLTILMCDESTSVDSSEALAKFQQMQEAAEQQGTQSPEDENKNPPPPSPKGDEEPIPSSEKLPEIQSAT